eukprot:gene164-194_t
MKSTLSLLLLISIVVGTVLAFTPAHTTLFFDDFQSDNSRWIRSSGSEGTPEFRSAENADPQDKGLLLPVAAKRYAITAKATRSIDNTGKDLVVQYEVQLQNGLECGGAYLKLYAASENFDVETVKSDTPYSIMFGPDKCGHDNRIHFIVRAQNPITKEWEEKLITAKPPIRTDHLSHLYTLLIKPDNTFKIMVDRTTVLEGDFHKDFTPAFNPPREINDPEDSKPSTWVDNAQIVDPEASKPDDWDESQPKRILDPSSVKPAEWRDNEPELVPSPTETMPEEWNEEDDGEWEAPMVPNPACEDGMCGEWTQATIDNPLYKGKWSAPMIPNPEYIGEWKPRLIANPAFFEVENPYIVEKIGAVGVEVWTMTSGILFDNIIIASDISEADRLAEETWVPKNALQKKQQAEKEAEEAAKLVKGDSFVEQAQLIFEAVVEYSKLNPAIAAASVFGGLLPIILCMMRQGSSNKITIPIDTDKVPVAATKPATATVESDEDSEEEEEEEEESEEEETPKSTTTKRTNKVK